MKSILSPLVASGALAIALNAFAGTDHSISRDLAVAPPPAAKSDWEFSVGLPGWLTGIKGDIGVAGLKPVHVDLPFTDLVSHIDMVAGMAVEAQHKRWGFYIVGLYEKLGVDGDPPGRLLNSASLSLREVIAEAGVTYRLWEGKRGYFDLLAGARLIYIGADISFDVDSSGVQAVSEDVANEVVSRLSNAVDQKASAALADARRAIADALATAKSDVSNKALELKSGARNAVETSARARIRDQVESILANHPHLPGAIAGIAGRPGPVNDALRRLIDAKVAEKRADINDAQARLSAQIQAGKAAVSAAEAAARAALNAKVQATKARARSQLQSAVRRAEQNLANKIAAAIKQAIPREASGSKSWVDPFVGFRARYNFTDNLYAAARADIGGFGVGSKLAWQAYGALGWQFNRHWSTELGYRYLSEDYESGGFVFDAAVAGAYLGVTYKF